MWNTGVVLNLNLGRGRGVEGRAGRVEENFLEEVAYKLKPEV